MIAQDINLYKSYSHANLNYYVLTCMITYIHTLYTCIRILNCKLTFVWQSGQCRKTALPTLHNCDLGSTRSVGRPGQGPPETPTTLQLHDGTTDILVGMEQGNTTYVVYEGESYIHFISCLYAELVHIESHRHDISKGCNQSEGKFIIFRELYSQLDVCFQEPSRASAQLHLERDLVHRVGEWEWWMQR